MFAFSSIVVNPMKTRNVNIGTLENSEDSLEDGMPQNPALQQGLHCLLKQTRS